MRAHSSARNHGPPVATHTAPTRVHGHQPSHCNWSPRENKRHSQTKSLRIACDNEAPCSNALDWSASQRQTLTYYQQRSFHIATHPSDKLRLVVDVLTERQAAFGFSFPKITSLPLTQDAALLHLQRQASTGLCHPWITCRAWSFPLTRLAALGRLTETNFIDVYHSIRQNAVLQQELFWQRNTRRRGNASSHQLLRYSRYGSTTRARYIPAKTHLQLPDSQSPKSMPP